LLDVGFRLFRDTKPSKLKLFDWKMLRKEKIMFKKSLYKAALVYFGDCVAAHISEQF
jgi:hypothetical protein